MRIHLGIGVLVALTAACSNEVFSGTGNGDAGADGDASNVVHGGGDAGDGGAKVDAVAPPNCDPSKLPTDDLCVVNDAEGVFVSTSIGDATGDGSREHPLASMNAAIVKAKKFQMRVYACAETYAEALVLADGVSTFGYFDCKNGWAVSAAHAKIQSPTSPAATAMNITSPTRVEAVDIIAPDFADQSRSSIALVASASPGLTIKGATIHAGTGGKGADGVSGIQLSDSSTKNGVDGKADGVCATCFPTYFQNVQGGTNACVGATGHDGGPGGAGGYPGKYLSQNFVGWIWGAVDQGATAGYPQAPTMQTAQGGGVGLGGSTGAPGASGAMGSGGAAFGSLSASAYVSSDGTNGTDGAPGQGGGGSGGYDNLTSDYPPGAHQGATASGSAGPGGGAGGCPGLAATRGTGGGASIAIVAIASAFTLDTVNVQSSAGGIGGQAGLPSAPTSGGLGGHAVSYTFGGGPGGAGGPAGVSGNGGGGPSIGIAFQGTKPTESATSVTQGAGGAGVAQRATTGGEIVPASPDGVSQATYSF